MISETLTPTTTDSAASTFNKGNAQMIIKGDNGAKGVLRLSITVANAKVPIYETRLPRNSAKVVVISDATAEFMFSWQPEDSPDNATVIVYLGQES